MLFRVPASALLAANLASVMKGPQTFDALLDQQLSALDYSPKRRAREPMALPGIEPMLRSPEPVLSHAAQVAQFNARRLDIDLGIELNDVGSLY